MVSAALTSTRAWAVIFASAALSTTAFAQAAPPKNAGDQAQAAPYPSAFKGYRAYADEPVTNWKAANDTVASIGGWREYAREAQAEDATPPRSVTPGAQPALNPAGKAKP